MSWQDKRSITRIFNTFRRLKSGIYQEDIDALKHVSESIEAHQRAFVNDNLLFAKLLCIIIKQEQEYYGGVNMAIKNINSQLRLPMSHHLQMLELSMNSVEQNNFLTSIGIDMKSHDFQRDVISNHQNEILEKLGKAWKYEAIEKSFYNTANEMLKETNNYV